MPFKTAEMLFLGAVGGFLARVLLRGEQKCAPCPVCPSSRDSQAGPSPYAHYLHDQNAPR